MVCGPLPALVGNNRAHIGGVGCELVINSSELVMAQTEKVSHILQVMALVLFIVFFPGVSGHH